MRNPKLASRNIKTNRELRKLLKTFQLRKYKLMLSADDAKRWPK